jgi:hypothetical protein
MKNMSDMPAQRGRMARWAIGITLASFVAGGGFAAVALTASGTPAGTAGPAASAGVSNQASLAATQANNAELNALLSAATGTGTGTTRIGPLRRLRRIGGLYGSITYRTKTGDRTLAVERGTIESVTGSNVVVRASDGTTMTWQLVSDTVVRDKGVKSATSALSGGQLVFVGGPVISGAKEARLIVIRTAGSVKAPATPAPSGSAGTSSALS